MTAGRKLNTLSQDWGTPEKYVNAVRACFGGAIDLDPCSNDYSIVHATTEYRLPEHDGLRDKWNFATIYVNPPYGIDKERGSSIKKWLSRCAMAHTEYHSEVLALVPVATNTGHWKKFVFGEAAGLCFLYDTRLKFLVNGKNGGLGAPMSCAMIYWGRKYETFLAVFKRFGAVVDLRPLQGQSWGTDLENGQGRFQFEPDEEDSY
ncbi:MAG: N-6 DNA methylase [Planctomycetes bacterium]|nr:N-6 DNA methylase [Planctomycetota bacterium]